MAAISSRHQQSTVDLAKRSGGRENSPDEELVPQDHFYRHLQEVLELSFVYELVRESYAMVGRPSIDPVVFFKLQLVMFFENTRSERLLM